MPTGREFFFRLYAVIPARIAMMLRGRRYWNTNIDNQYISPAFSVGQFSKHIHTPGTVEEWLRISKSGKAVRAETTQMTATINITDFLVSLDFTGKTIARYLSAVMANRVPMETESERGRIT